MDIRSGILSAAGALGVNPLDLATAISYETAGTFDPMKTGPTTQWGQHRGLIQFGEPQAKQYGVSWDDPVGSQLGPQGAVANYLRDTGVKPGMGLLDIYSAINAGGVGRYNRSDANNGGAPGTVRDKVEKQMAGHRKKAEALLGGAGSDTLAGGLSMTPSSPPDTLQGAQMQPEQQQRQHMFLKNMDPATRDRLIMAMQGMTMNPNQGLMGMAQQNMQDRRADAKDQKAQGKLNKTREWILKQVQDGNLPPVFAQLAEVDPAGAYSQAAGYLTKGGDKPDYVYHDGQWFDKNNPQAGPVQMPGGGAAPIDAKGEGSLRKEYTGLADVKSFKQQADAFTRIRASADQPDAAGDLALIFNYMKLLDPGSVVREGEFATAQNAAGVDDRVRNVWNRLQNGERLAPEQRQEFVARAGKIYEAARGQNENTETQYRQTAIDYGYDPQRTVPDVNYQSPYAPQGASRPGQRPATPEGFTGQPKPALTKEQLRAAISNLSPHDQNLLSSIPGMDAKLRFLVERGVIQ